jgi:hypothetical protein
MDGWVEASFRHRSFLARATSTCTPHQHFISPEVCSNACEFCSIGLLEAVPIESRRQLSRCQEAEYTWKNRTWVFSDLKANAKLK